MSLRIRDVIDPKALLIAPPDASVAEAARLMTKRYAGAILICTGQKLIGIFTKRDAVVRVIARGRDPQATLLADVMTEAPDTVDPDESFAHALLMMHENGYRQAPVVKNGKVIGVVLARNALDPIWKNSLRDHNAENRFVSSRREMPGLLVFTPGKSTR